MRSALLVAALVGASVLPAGAQVVEMPSRPLRGIFGGGRPVDPNRPRQELSSQFDLLGGYDDNLAAGATGGAPFQTARSGYTGFGDASLRYFVGNVQKSLDLSGHGFVNTFQNAGLGPMYGSSLAASGRMALGSKSAVNFTQTLRADPFYTLGAFAPLSPDLGFASPDYNLSNALGTDRSRSLGSTVQASRSWTRRLSTDGTYSYSKTTYQEGVRSDTHSQQASAGVSRAIGRGTNIRGSYRYLDSEYVLPLTGERTPLSDHNIDMGFSQDRPMSRTRRLSYSFGGGASYTTPLYHGDVPDRRKFWTPSGYASLRVDVSRSWNVSGDFRRRVSVLQGVTPETFISNVASVRAGGYIGRMLEAAFIVGYSDGQVGEGTAGRYESYTGTGQIRVRITQWWSALVSYNRYQHSLTNTAASSLGVIPDSNSNSVRIGFTWFMPFIGQYLGPPAAAN